MKFKRQTLTLQAVGVQQILALLVAFDSTLGTPHALAGDPPQQSFTLVAICWRRGRPRNEIVRGCAADWVDQRLKSFLIHVHFLI